MGDFVRTLRGVCTVSSRRALLIAVASAVVGGAGCDGSARKLGVSGQYALDYTSELELGEARGGFRVTGTLDVESELFTLRDLRCRRLGDESREALDGFCADLAGSYPLRRERDGRISAIAVPETQGLESDGALKHLVSVVQLRRSAQAGASEWTTTETDTVGEYEAHYSEGHGVLLRSKRRYVGEGSGVEVDGSTEFRFDSSGRTTSLRSFDAVDRSGEATSGFPDSRASTRVHLRRSGPSSEHSPTLSVGVRWMTLDGGASAKAEQRSLDERRVGEASYEQLVASLRETPERDATDARQRYDRASMALISLLRLREDNASKVESDCSKLESWCRVALGALGAAGTPRAQQALIAIHESLRRTPDTREQASLRRQAVRSLGTRLAELPTPAAVRFLGEVLGDGTVGAQAAYGLGALAKMASDRGDDRLTKECLQPLFDGISTASVDARVVYLKALSNARVPEIVPRVEPLTGSENARIAAAAITSLYGLDLAHSAALIERGLQDRRDAVRHAAVKVLAVQDGAWGEELHRAVETISRDPEGGLSARLAGRVLSQRSHNRP